MKALTTAIRHYLKSKGVDKEVLANTPHRFVGAFDELTSGYSLSPKQILSKVFNVGFDEMILVRDVSFWSLCEHHLLPFGGTATVAYIPTKRVVGLSKIPRLVHCFARRLQVQERLTRQIADAMQLHLEPAGVGVLVRSRHSCMSMRGIKSDGEMVTSCLLGAMRTNPAARQEFLDLARGSR